MGDSQAPGPSATNNDSNHVPDVENVDGRATDGDSTTTLMRDVAKSPLQGPVSTEYDRSAGELICVGGIDDPHVQQSKNKCDDIYGPTKVLGLGGDKLVDDVRPGGIERRQGTHHTTGDLVTKTIRDDQSTRSHPLEYCEVMVVEGKRVETLETAAGGIEKVWSDPETSAPHVSAAGKIDIDKSVESSAAKNARVPSISAEVEPTEDRVTCGRTVETESTNCHLCEARVVDGNHSNGVAHSDGSVKTDPKQALFLKHDLTIGSLSKKRGSETKQAGGDLREKGHSRDPSVESQMGLMPTKTPIVSDTKLEEGEHPGSRIPFPGGTHSPKVFSWSGDGHLGPYFVVVVEQSHARSGGLAILLGLVICAAYGWWF
jgi:hypothetical protein